MSEIKLLQPSPTGKQQQTTRVTSWLLTFNHACDQLDTMPHLLTVGLTLCPWFARIASMTQKSATAAFACILLHHSLLS